MRNLLVSLLLLFATSAALAEVSPMTIDGATTVTTEEAHKLFKEGALFVDVRRDSDWDAGRVSGAAHLNLKTNFSADSLGGEISKDEKVVIYCNGEKCLRSSAACAKAVEWGFSNVYYYRDGFPAWKSAGLPTE